MSITHTISRSWAGQNGTPIAPAGVSFTGTEELNFDFTLNANTANYQVSLAFTKSLLQSMFVYTDTQNVTMKTNSSSAPQDTLTLTAGEPLAWDVTSPLANPFANNVNTAFFTNSAGTSTKVQVRCLTNG